MEAGRLENREGVYVPRPMESFPLDDPFRRLVTVEVEDSSKGKYQFDETYPYVDRSFKYLFNKFIGFFFQWFVAVPSNYLKMGLRVVGRKVLKPWRKALKNGAVVVCNHTYRMDALCAFSAVRRFRRMWIPMYAKHFNGKDHWFIRYVGGIPVPETLGGTRRFNEAFDYYHGRGDWVLVFPESVRWDYYQPLRPFRKGAFSMAYRWNVPIVPCVISWRPRTGLYKLFGKEDEPLATITVCEPVIPDVSASRKEEIDRLRVEAHSRMEKAAGIIANPWPALPSDGS